MSDSLADQLDDLICAFRNSDVISPREETILNNCAEALREPEAQASGMELWLESVDKDGYRTDAERSAARCLLRMLAAAPVAKESDHD